MTATACTAFVNGQYLPREQASLPIEDRGTLFSDGVYEVLLIQNAQPLLLEPHVQRMARGLAGIAIDAHAQLQQLPEITRQLIERSGIQDGTVYWQITRGSAARKHLPAREPTPSLTAMIYPGKPLDPEAPPATRTALLCDDQRWTQCWIKSLMLLPSTLALRQARDAGCDEAILHRDGRVTEASSSNILTVRDQSLITPPADQWILPGITRQVVLELARGLGIDVQEKTFTTDDLLNADEIMLTGTTSYVTAVTHVDQQPIGSGEVGALTQRLCRTYRHHLAQACGLASAALQPPQH